MYSDIRVIDRLGIRQVNGVWDVAECLLTKARVDAMNEYARVLFGRRRLQRNSLNV